MRKMVIIATFCAPLMGMDGFTDTKDLIASLIHSYQWGKLSVHKKKKRKRITFQSINASEITYSYSVSYCDHLLRIIRTNLIDDSDEDESYSMDCRNNQIKDILKAYKNFVLLHDLPDNCRKIEEKILFFTGLINDQARLKKECCTKEEAQYYIQLMEAILKHCKNNDETLNERMDVIKINRYRLLQAFKEENVDALIQAIAQPIQLAQMFLPSSLDINQIQEKKI